jgi:hypothetical protein
VHRTQARVNPAGLHLTRAPGRVGTGTTVGHAGRGRLTAGSRVIGCWAAEWKRGGC